MTDARVAVPIADALLLSAWLGAAILFVASVAPAAFSVLPTRTLAGELVGRVLPVVFYSGMVIGAVTVALDLAARTGDRGRLAASALAAVSCAIAQIVVGSRIARLRAEIGGPIDALAPDDVRRIAFGKMHAWSVGWLGLAMVAATVALVLAVRAAQARR